MPPKIALLLCVIFILYLFKIDFKRKSNVSSALWIPLIWMMILGSRMPSLWLTPKIGYASPEAYLEGNPFNRNIFIILITAGIFVLYRRKIDLSQILQKNSFLFVFLLYCLISILWSDFPVVSFKRWIKTLGIPIMVLVILSDPDPVEAVKTMIRRCAYVLIPLSVIFIKYLPHLGRSCHRYTDEAMYIGVATSKNSLGHLCLICGIFFFWNLLTMLRNKKVLVDKRQVFNHFFLLLIILWLLEKANSATSLVCFIIGICVLLVFESGFIKKNIKYIGRIIFFILLCFLPFILLGYDFLLSSTIDLIGHADTFWGRVQTWPQYIDLMDASPLIGTGYDSFWLGDRLKELWGQYRWHPTEAHNGYLGIYLELGIIGVILLIGVIFSALRNICKTFTTNFDFGVFQISFLIIILFYNITESAFKGLHLVWFIFFLIAMEYPRLHHKSLEGGLNRHA